MILALLLMQAAATPESDPFVLARRMQAVAIDLKTAKRNGRMVIDRCRVTRSGGIAELDAVPCAAARQCAAQPLRTGHALERCVTDRQQLMLDAIVARRGAAARP